MEEFMCEEELEKGSEIIILKSIIEMKGSFPMMGLNVAYVNLPINSKVIKTTNGMIVSVRDSELSGTTIHYLGKINKHKKATMVWNKALSQQ